MLNSIFRLVETRPEQEWSNGTESSGYSDFSEFLANLARYTQNFGIKFLKISVPFGVFGIFLVRSFQVLGAPRLWAKAWVRETVAFLCLGPIG